MDKNNFPRKRKRVIIPANELIQKKKLVGGNKKAPSFTKNEKPTEGTGPEKKFQGRKREEDESLSAKQRKEKWYFEKYLAKKELEIKATLPNEGGLIRLNKYLAMCGVSSRRSADEFIKAGRVAVNGRVETVVGRTISISDKVSVDGKELELAQKVYVLLNKPKDFISTMKDPQGRRTIADLIKNISDERIYPVGRLDRNTTGLILLTNDGDLAQKLMHPSYEAKKVYLAVLDKRLKKAHKEMIAGGFNLEDGPIKVDAISYVEGAPDKRHVGVELHSGRNRIIHRIFEHFGYKLDKLDRVYYAGLTKANLLRGKWRHLSPEEVSALRQMVSTKRLEANTTEQHDPIKEDKNEE